MSWFEITTVARCRVGFARTSLVKKKTMVDARGSLLAASHTEEYEVAILLLGASEVVGVCVSGLRRWPNAQ